MVATAGMPHQGGSGSTEQYMDPTRYKWLLNPVWMLMPILSVLLVVSTGTQAFVWITPVLLFVAFPIMDAIIGADIRNHPDEEMERVENDPFYRNVTYFTVACHYATFLTGAWAVAALDLSVASYAGLAISVGLINGFAVATGHELGHKRGKFERWMGKLSLAISAYVVDFR